MASEMQTPLVEPLRPWPDGNSDAGSDDDSSSDDPFAVDAVDIDVSENRLKSARWLARSHLFGRQDEADRPIYRVWTNIRGVKVHGLIVLGSGIVMLSYFAFRTDKSEPLYNVFTLHIVSMLLAWVLFSDGIVAYRAGAIGSNSVEALRRRHQRLMILAVICIFCGLVSIIAHKSDEGHLLTPKSYHGILGTIIVILCIPQVRVGALKLRLLLRNQGKSYRWHGNFGQLLYALMGINVALGFMEVDSYSESDAAFWVFCVGFILVTITTMAAMFQPTIFGSDQFDQAAPTRDISDHDVELVEV